MRSALAVVVLVVLMAPASAYAQGDYASTVLATPGLQSYWRLGDASGTVAADATGRSPGAFSGGVELGARGALSSGSDTAARFDGVDDELQATASGSGTLEGWFFWESGVALMRDSTSAGGWILAYDSGGKVAYRAGGVTFVTGLATSAVRDGWHHVVLTVSGGATAFYVDGALVHSGTGAGAVAPVLPWRVMHNGTTAGQFTRGRADEVAVYGAALSAATVGAHFAAGRDGDSTAPPAPMGLTAVASLGSVQLDWPDVAAADLDGYDVYRATSAAGPFTRVNPSRLSASAFTDASVTGGSTYVYAVSASDEANNRSPLSGQASATPPSATDLLRRYSPSLRYETQETYFADSAAEMTDNFVAGSRQNFLVSGTGSRLAAANPADPLANLSLSFLGDPVYADGRAATTSDYLDEANSSYQQDAQRLRAAGYGDRVYGRVATAGGKTWLQYWFFSYYNPQNVLGFGVHEGDGEFVQVGLDASGAPDVATYAQHDGGERCDWSRVQRTADGAPVVYVALASHASYFASGINPRGLYPDDYHRGGGYSVRPALDVVTASTPFMAWRGKWGASSSSPLAPRRQGKWGDPGGFDTSAAGCTVGATQAAATVRALAAGDSVATPVVDAQRSGGLVVVRYGAVEDAATLVVSASASGAPDVATARRVRPRRGGGTVTLRLPSGARGPFVVRASAFSEHGARSHIADAPVR